MNVTSKLGQVLLEQGQISLELAAVCPQSSLTMDLSLSSRVMYYYHFGSDLPKNKYMLSIFPMMNEYITAFYNFFVWYLGSFKTQPYYIQYDF